MSFIPPSYVITQFMRTEHPNPRKDLEGLEADFANLCFRDAHLGVFTKDFMDFGCYEFYEPNEYPKSAQGNKQLVPHFQQVHDGGILVSCGTERGFFNLLLSEGKFVGLVNIDLNPKVKAYFDFNVLLLRISESFDEYVTLSTPLQRVRAETETFENRVELIQDKINKSNLPSRIQSYYLQYLKSYAHVYLLERHAHAWRSRPEFEGMKYCQDPNQFSILQKYAKSGNIISLEGKINDLTFLKNRNITFIDTSNICDYSLIKPILKSNCSPRVMTTHVFNKSTLYSSFLLHQNELSQEESAEFDTLLATIQNMTTKKDIDSINASTFFAWMQRTFEDTADGNEFNSDSGAIYSRATLIKMKEYVSMKTPPTPFRNYSFRTSIFKSGATVTQVILHPTT